MSLLRISLFGGLQVTHEGLTNRITPTRAVQILLAYLVLHRRRLHSRETLLGVFWGEQDPESARNCLNTTLWRLRRVLEPTGVSRGMYLITSAVGEVGFNDESPFWLDVDVLERGAAAVLNDDEATLTKSNVVQLEEAVALYSGDILDGVYDDWALRERERVRAVYLKSLTCLMRYHQARGGRERSAAFAEEILRQDPLREDIHRALIRLHIDGGERALAVRQYDQCRRALATELGVEPMPETQALLRCLDRPHRNDDSRSIVEPVRGVGSDLREALYGVERAVTQLRTVLGRVEAVLNGPRR